MKSLVLLLVPATTFAASIHYPRDDAASTPPLAPASSLPSGWDYAGCSVDALNPRSLSLAFYRDDAGMTGETCIAYCSSKGYNVAGTEYSSECYCGTTLPSLAEESDCDMACSGDSTEACGGPARLSVYSNVVQGAPQVNPGVGGFVSYGCVADSVAERTLPNGVQVQGPMTVALCVSACQAGGYAFAGVEVRAALPPPRPTKLTQMKHSTPKSASAATAPRSSRPTTPPSATCPAPATTASSAAGPTR